MSASSPLDIPTIDIAPLSDAASTAPARGAVAAAIDVACREHGFFAIVGHGIDPDLIAGLEATAREFFERSDHEKASIQMALAGTAWRGWFPVGGELTSGVPDRKEGLYVGRELAVDDQRVVTGVPLHGPNQFPVEPAALGPIVLRWLDECLIVGQRVLGAIAVGLGLPPSTFSDDLTADPTILFRIFHYPAEGPGTWGVAEHTDYGLLTLLLQDDSGGLEVHTRTGWVPVPPEPGAIVCNIGDMLERLTGGIYQSTPHRVIAGTRADRRGRLSYPFFLDPGWDTTPAPLEIPDATAPTTRALRRWDGADPLDFAGTYGDYLSAKVARVFPGLFAPER
jgi:isopenicillin N synthase-like dioxygenase